MPQDVLIAVLTYRRPLDLAEVLPQLVAQAQAEARTRAGSVSVLIVDNDPEGSAKATLDGLELPAGRVRYVHEPRPGIAAARNRALDEAGAARVLVFVDDDERPRENWLEHLLATHAAHGGPGVVGPVISSFAAPPEEWITAGGFFTRRRLPTGTPVTVAATNNLLLDVAAVGDLRFDEGLGLSGGSDTLFTRALTATAGPLVWCDEAIVTDVVPPERSTRNWVLRRQVRSGNSESRTTLMLTPSPLTRTADRLRLAVRGGLRVAGGAAKVVLGTVTGRLAAQASGARNVARGTGMVLGAFGWTYAEYKR